MTDVNKAIEHSESGEVPLNILRTELKAALKDLASILREEEKKETGQSPAGFLGIVEDKLADDQFHLAVLGQFKRGKSSFINALLGETVLPTGAIPLTSVVTVLRWGPQIAVNVVHRDGAGKPTTPENLHRFVTERENPGNHLGVSHVEIAYPSDFLQRGVVLVDTPGVGSVQEANTRETLDYLPRIDAAIFLLSADQPLNTEELSFLETSRSFAPRYFFILNKIDLLSNEDLAESLSYCERVLSEKMQEKVSVHPVSALWHLEGRQESGIPELQRTLEQFLEGDRDILWLEGNVRRLQRAVNLLSDRNRLERNAVLASRQELDQAVERLHALRLRAEEAKDDCRHILAGESRQALQALTEKVELYRREQGTALSREFWQEYLKSTHEPPNLQEEIFRHLEETLERFRPELTWEMEQKIAHLLRRFNLQAGELASEVAHIGGKVLGVEVGVHLPEPELRRESNLEYFFEEETGLIPWGLKDLVRPFPWPLRKRVVLRHLTNRALLLLDRNCGRIREDLAERFTFTKQDYFRAWQQEIDRVVSEISSAVERGLHLQEDQVALAGWQKEIAHREKMVADVARRLAELSEPDDSHCAFPS
ncbi:bacterial dynamin-like protein [Peptococcaceae bacterium CEB3]|nr:bacterial dynamin-like protein [Peptococcaceae bacterium CEB3]